MQSTILKYMDSLENMSLYEDFSKVLNIEDLEDGRKALILDQTIFYPQGGGQPYDQGIIETANSKFIVEEVRFVEGIVKHIGRCGSGNFEIGESVKCIIDKERRILNTRLHSAGHLVDMAINALNLNLIPHKGYHFPNGPYVEYEGFLSHDMEKLKKDIEDLANSFISQKIETTVQFMNKEEMKKICRYVPDNMPANKPMRVVIYGDFAVPCGGTHVRNLGDILAITIRKIKQDKSLLRISYEIGK